MSNAAAIASSRSPRPSSWSPDGSISRAIAPAGRQDRQPSPTAATAPTSSPDKRWLAVAPGRVEPPSGKIKVAAPAVGIVSKVLVKVNDTVFAGEPLILLNDDEIQSRYAAAEAQVGDAQARCATSSRRPARPPTAARPRTRVADAETAVFDAQDRGRPRGGRLAASGEPDAEL